jgi:hypothetical protein
MNYITINENELQQHKTQLTQHILSGTHVLHGNPFLENTSTMFEEFGIWRPEFFESLQKALQHESTKELIVVKYAQVEGMLTFTQGYRLPVHLDFETYNSLGFDLDFIGNGSESFLFDDSYSWCVGTVVDAHFVGAHPEIFSLFYADETVIAQKKMNFEAWASDKHIMDAYKVMPTYIQ